jgi:excisionase family DNA binding protein
LTQHGADQRTSAAKRKTDRMTPAHTEPHNLHLTPEQAAQLAKVSRWTILRAIKSHKLQARRDNRNRWQISPHDLAAWSAHTVQAPAHTVQAQEIAHLAPNPAQADEAPALRAALTAETARADAAERARDQAEADRNQWRDMAQTLAKRPRSIWPWSR